MAVVREGGIVMRVTVIAVGLAMNGGEGETTVVAPPREPLIVKTRGR